MISKTVINQAAFLDALASRAPSVMYVLGVALLLRRFLGLQALPLVGAAVAVLLFLTAVNWLVRRRYDRDFARAWYDRTNAAGGRILAGSDAFPLGRLPALSGRHLFSRLMYPGLFLLVACMVPPPEQTQRGSGAGIGRAVQAARRDIREAAADQLITERQRETFTAQVERIREMVREDRREAAAEALAALEERLRRASRETVDQTETALEQAGGLLREFTEAERVNDNDRRRMAAEGLAELERNFRQFSGSPGTWREDDMSAGGREEPGSQGVPGGEPTSDNAERDTAAFLSALEEHGRQMADAVRKRQAGGSGSESGTNGRERTGEGAGDGSVASRLMTASEALAELLGNSSPSLGPGSAGQDQKNAGGASGTTAGIKPGHGAGDPSGNTSGSQTGTASGGTPGTGFPLTGRSGSPGVGGTGHGRADTPLVLGDISRRQGESVRFTPLTRTGRSGYDGPELRRERTAPDPGNEPDARRDSSRSAFDPPAGAAAGRASSAPGPTRGRWVDEYFGALEKTE